MPGTSIYLNNNPVSIINYCRKFRSLSLFKFEVVFTLYFLAKTQRRKEILEFIFYSLLFLPIAYCPLLIAYCFAFLVTHPLPLSYELISCTK